MKTISLKIMLCSVAFIAIAICAFLNPNRLWVLVTDIVIAGMILFSMAVAIGSIGRQRVAAVSFFLTALACFVAVRQTDFPLSNSMSISCSHFSQLLGTTERRQAPDGTIVSLGSDGLYNVRLQNKGDYIKMTSDEIGKRNLHSYARTPMNNVSFKHFSNIFRNVLFVLLSGLMSIVASNAYGTRGNSHSAG